MAREYSEKTEALLQRMDNVALRQEFIFDKPKIEELLKKSYKSFNLEMPKIIWCKDITDEKFLGAAMAAMAAGTARAARAAWIAGAAMAARAAGTAMIAGAAMAARAAGTAMIAGIAGAAWAAIDYNGQEFAYLHEWLEDPKNERNENDLKALEAWELFLELKEAGMGYFAEQDRKLYVVPNPVVRLNNLRYHSEDKPSIEWKDGLQMFYLHGINLEKDLWQKILSKKMTFKEIMAIGNIEQRMIALKYHPDTLVKSESAKLIDTWKNSRTDDDIELYEVNGIFNRTQYFASYKDPSTDRMYVSAIDPDAKEFKKTALSAMAWKFNLIEHQYANEIIAEA